MTGSILTCSEQSTEVSPLIVATATDRYFLELAGVMLMSLVSKGELDHAKLIVFADGLRSEDKDRLRACVRGRALFFIDLDRHALRKLQGVRTTAVWGRTVYARLLMPELLGVQKGRLLYLDADTLVLESLKDLVSVDMRGNVLAAVHDPATKDNDRLGLSPTTLTFNSGVLLVDLDKWLKLEIGRRSVDLAKQRAAKRLPAYDQDVLNIIVNGNFLSSMVDGT